MKGTKNNSKNASTGLSVAKINTANVQKNAPKTANKQKILLPTLKEQQRYVVYKIITKIPFKNFDSIHNNILSQCNTMLGIFDGGKAGLMSAKYNAEKMSGVIRVNNTYVDKLKVCLGLIKTINSQDVVVDCVYVSGMLHKAIDKMDA
jgi:RNase P/RNase MRP subunit POP5